MKHLYSYSSYQPLSGLPGEGTAAERAAGLGCDGLELLTPYGNVPGHFIGASVAAHLPFAADWYSGWAGRADLRGMDEGWARYVYFGRDRGEMVRNVALSIERAAEIDPAYCVVHAGSANLGEVTLRRQTDDSRGVLSALAEMMNEVAASFKGGEPPARLAFENLWWPGLRLRENWERRLLEDRLEFENWGLCLDTGHLMNTLPGADDEESAIDGALEVIDGYDSGTRERICAMHFHLSASAEYRRSFKEEPRPEGETVPETMSRVYPHITRIDQHRPFSSPRCVELAEAISPEFLTHEMMGSESGDPIADLRKQIAHFGR
ncbi:MAG: sugar phosphate isomerase/epimerase [Candidatus Methanoplasma sp.]|jgi:sugar phosphate isomerase/epimerase|nr:sugar phosphate isomerase/epimerase [Candidatus Methanoplasma sp.]